MDEEVHLLLKLWEIVNEQQIKISNKVYKFCNERKVANSICKKIEADSEEIKIWLTSISGTGNGRPLNFEADKKVFKSKKMQLIQSLENHGYLFNEGDRVVLQRKVELIQYQWRKIVKDQLIDDLKLKVKMPRKSSHYF